MSEDEKPPLWIYVGEASGQPGRYIVEDLRTHYRVGGLTAAEVLEQFDIDIAAGDKIPRKPR